MVLSKSLPHTERLTTLKKDGISSVAFIPRVLLYPSGGSVRSFDGSVKSWEVGRKGGRAGGREQEEVKVYS